MGGGDGGRDGLSRGRRCRDCELSTLLVLELRQFVASLDPACVRLPRPLARRTRLRRPRVAPSARLVSLRSDLLQSLFGRDHRLLGLFRPGRGLLERGLRVLRDAAGETTARDGFLFRGSRRGQLCLSLLLLLASRRLPIAPCLWPESWLPSETRAPCSVLGCA